MATQRIEERFAFTGGTVDTSDPENPVVRNVPLCGSKSVNRRRYLRQAFEGDRVKRYGKKPSFLNHGKQHESRDYESKIATVINERHREDGLPIGDLAVNPHHPHAKAFLWDAQHHPESIGMSHVAHCETRVASDGWAEVTEIVEVESVDVVIGPATTSGLFTAEGKTVPHTIKTLLTEWVTKHPKATSDQLIRAKQFLEFDMGMAETPVMDVPADDADPEDGLTAAFKAYLHAHVDALADESQTIDEFTTKVKAAFKAHKGKEPKKDGESGTKDAAEEAKTAKALADLPFTILSECQAKNFTPGTATLKAMVQMTAEERAAFITEQAAKGSGHSAERIESAQRRPGAGTAGNPNAGGGTGGTQKVEEQRLIPAW